MAEMRYYKVVVAPSIWDYPKTTFVKAHSPKDFLGYKVPNPKSEGFYLTVKNTKYFDGNVSYIRYNKITKEQYQAAQVADWIEKALKMEGVRECQDAFLRVTEKFLDMGISRRAEACALGLAFIGKYGNVENAIDSVKALKKLNLSSRLDRFMAESLGIEFNLADSINWTHCASIPASEIAKKLRNGETLPYDRNTQ
jgi:hypothetical protein